jgi:hypothetical protein
MERPMVSRRTCLPGQVSLGYQTAMERGREARRAGINWCAVPLSETRPSAWHDGWDRENRRLK